jgi:hypothetical protein
LVNAGWFKCLAPKRYAFSLFLCGVETICFVTCMVLLAVVDG